MGHKRFHKDVRFADESRQQTAERNDRSGPTPRRTPYPQTRDYLEEMAPVNGVKKLSEAELEEATRRRDEFRDEVSTRMGGLLLKGVTMLDAYCEQCNGILMESRDGTRTCVACELYREKHRPARILHEVPLDELDDDLSPASSAREETGRSRVPPAREIVQVMDVPRGSWMREQSVSADRMSMYESSSAVSHSQPSAPSTKGVPSGAPVGAKKVKRDLTAVGEDKTRSLVLFSVERKLEWASQQLDSTHDISRCREILALLSEGMELLEKIKH